MKEALGRARAAFVRVASLLAALSAAAMTWFVALSIAGAALLMSGIYTLFGLGWALIAGGILCAGMAAVVLKGMSRG